jgi:hypothetical protein
MEVINHSTILHAILDLVLAYERVLKRKDAGDVWDCVNADVIFRLLPVLAASNPVSLLR